MTVRILFFAAYADLVGRASLDLPVQAPLTVADLLQRLRAELPGAAGLPARVLVAVNQALAGPGTPVADGDEVAVLPPMAGG